MIRGTSTEERFIYEIMWLCLIIALTRFDELRKIGGIQGTKEKTTSELSRFGRQEELLIAYPSDLKRSSLQYQSQATACVVAGGF